MQKFMKKEREDLPSQIYDIIMHKLGDDIKNIILNELEKENASPSEIMIPILIFKNILSPLEALVKYLKENLHMRYHEIAQKLNRDDRTIWITYRNSQSKYIEYTCIDCLVVPLSIFSDRKFSVLENLATHLKTKYGYTNRHISELLDKQESTIWTVLHRAKVKRNM